MGDGKEEAAVEVVGAEPVPEAAPRLSDPDVRAIVDAFYVEDEAARLRELLGLIQQTLYPLAPDSAYLLEQHGRLLFRLEQWQRAYEQFEAIDPDRLTPEAVVMWFVSACRAGINAEFDTILGYFNAWEQTALTDQLIEVLPLVSAERRLGILEGAWLGAGRYGKVWETVRATFARDDHVLRAVQLMVDPDLYNLLSPAQGYGYLYDHVESWAGAPADHLEQAVQWGLAEPDRVEDLEEAFLALVTCRLTRADDPEALLSLVEEGRALSPYTWAEAAEQVADALAGHESAVWRAMAGSLYVNLARHYRERLQNLDAAEESLTRAHLLAGEGTDAQLEAHIEAEETAWTEAVEGLEQIRMWRDGMIEVRLKRLRAHMHGKRAIFVGGLKRSFDVETIRVELGLDEAEFIPHFQSERGNLGKIQNAIHQGKVDYVVDFIRFGAHRNLDQHCEGTPVTYVRVPSGRSLTQIVRALSAVHQIDLQ
jgi:tetratricopeptide (TPR) repeat protein